MILSMELIRDLAVLRPGNPVLSVYVRTDPRDPANTAASPGWLVELRNGLRQVSRGQDEDQPRDQRLALRELCERVDRDVLVMQPADRGRGLAWFLTADGTLDRRLTLQLPPFGTLVRWDDRPFVSPLVEVADLGRPTGLVLVSAQAVRLLHWEAGLATEPARSLYEMEPGRWRDYDAYVGHPGTSAAGMHVGEFDQRRAQWREQFLRATARAVADRVAELGWERMLLVGEARVTNAFAQHLPETVAGQVVATVGANLLWEQHGAIADRVEDSLREAWLRGARSLAEDAIERAQAGGTGAIGWPEVMRSLVQHRAHHVIISADAAPEPDVLDPATQEALGWPSRPMVIERAVEQAVISRAEVTALRAEAPELAHAGGAAAILRY